MVTSQLHTYSSVQLLRTIIFEYSFLTYSFCSKTCYYLNFRESTSILLSWAALTPLIAILWHWESILAQWGRIWANFFHGLEVNSTAKNWHWISTEITEFEFMNLLNASLRKASLSSSIPSRRHQVNLLNAKWIEDNRAEPPRQEAPG